MQYRHLFFDLDHTLWDFESNARETLHEVFEINSLHEKGVDDRALFIRRYCFHNDCLWKKYTEGKIRQDVLRWKRMWLTLLDFKIADELLARKMANEFLERLPFKKNIFPHTREILQYLLDKSYHLHLVTNGFDHIQNAKLKSSELHHFFEEVITAEASNSLKPNAEIFEFALQKSKADKKQSIMLGDNPDADIKGAMNAGMDTVFVNHLNIQTELKPTYTIYHLKELELIF
ncbi:MAG: YjjG family noncanonical pyrimidine nucleotidase [Bacteroidetes bacterium]|nr:YjjG family noncanonical pyrimidine nucleotidase [Bacteroidota bacterium]